MAALPIAKGDEFRYFSDGGQSVHPSTMTSELPVCDEEGFYPRSEYSLSTYCILLEWRNDKSRYDNARFCRKAATMDSLEEVLRGVGCTSISVPPKVFPTSAKVLSVEADPEEDMEINCR